MEASIKEVASIAKKIELNFRFHNPNSIEATTEAILKLCILANRAKAEQAIYAAVNQTAPPCISPT